MMLRVLCLLGFLFLTNVSTDETLFDKVKGLLQTQQKGLADLLETQQSELNSLLSKQEEGIKSLLEAQKGGLGAMLDSHKKGVNNLVDAHHKGLDDLKYLIEKSKPPKPRYYNCDDPKKADPSATSGQYQLFMNKEDEEGFPVWCEFSEDGNRMVILRRINDTMEFSNKRWKEYQRGFGQLGANDNFWVGLERVHKMTDGEAGYTAKLKIRMRDDKGNEKYAKYSLFSIASEKQKYRLSIDGFSGTVAGDALKYSNLMPFSTINKDNDENPSVSCSALYHGAGWFKDCLEANLMGEYLTGSSHFYGRGIVWKYWDDKTNIGMMKQLSFVEMGIELKQRHPESTNGEYTLYVDKSDSKSVYQGYCLFEEDGSWLSLMRRVDASVDFYRGWEDYKRGFGDISGNFWVGNELIHKLTTRHKAILKMVMKGVAVPSRSIVAATKYAQYSTFRLAGEEDNYRLAIGGFEGNVGGDSMNNHNEANFTTKDKDDSGSNCAVQFQGAWWYNSCNKVQFTGQYLTPGWDESLNGHGIVWKNWGGKVGESYKYTLAYADMRIKF